MANKMIVTEWGSYIIPEEEVEKFNSDFLWKVKKNLIKFGETIKLSHYND